MAQAYLTMLLLLIVYLHSMANTPVMPVAGVTDGAIALSLVLLLALVLLVLVLVLVLLVLLVLLLVLLVLVLSSLEASQGHIA
jgi:hypothetical protein